jgi:hypothetical protein
MDGYIYGGLEDRNDGNGVLAAWDVDTLTMVRHRTTEQRDFPWVAVNPETKNLWSSSWVRFFLYILSDHFKERMLHFQYLGP